MKEENKIEVEGELKRDRLPFTQIENAIVKDDSISKHALIVYLVLCYHADKDGRNSFPGLNTIQKEARSGKTTVIEAIKELVDAGYITKEKRRNPNNPKVLTSNLYTINIQYDYKPRKLKKPKKGGSPEQDHPSPNEDQGVVLDRPCNDIPSEEYPFNDNVSEEIEPLFKFLKIPEKDQLRWTETYKNEKEYLLRQLRYAREKESVIKDPVKWIQKALDNDYASSDKDEIEKREREWQAQKDLENAQAEPIPGLTCSFDTDIEENPRERIRLWNQMLMECRGHPEVASKIREMIKGIQSGMGPKQQAEKYHNEIEPLMKDREREPVPA